MKITFPVLRFRRQWAKFISEFKFYPWSKCTLTLRFNRGNPSSLSPFPSDVTPVKIDLISSMRINREAGRYIFPDFLGEFMTPHAPRGMAESK